jgi:WD40-like Beta Propeller Repeat
LQPHDGGACVLVERQGRAETISLIDPIKGRGPKVLEMAGEFASDPTMSPDGRHIAFVPGGAVKNRIRIIDLHGVTESEIAVADAKNFASLEWSADGTGFFSADLTLSGTRLLHIERDGASQVLWTQPSAMEICGFQSPDGQYLATFKRRISSNVWIVEKP